MAAKLTDREPRIIPVATKLSESTKAALDLKRGTTPTSEYLAQLVARDLGLTT